MKHAVAALMAAVTLVVVAAASASPSTLVRGVVLRGPVTPVCVEGRPCSAPVANRVVAFSRGGADVARTSTNELGRFSVRLAPGTYGVRLVGQSRLARLSPRAVDVRPSGPMWVRLDLDTGIRSPAPPIGD